MNICSLKISPEFRKQWVAAKKAEIEDWLERVKTAENEGRELIAMAAPDVAAKVGNIQIAADHHGMGFTCSIDGEPVKRLRSVTLRLAVDRANTVTVEVLPDHDR